MGPNSSSSATKLFDIRNFEGILANMESESKRRKIDQQPSRRITSTGKEEGVAKSVPISHIGDTYLRIQQAKNFAIAQAQQDGCTGNYRIFDSPFGNYFVPVVPTRKDLAA